MFPSVDFIIFFFTSLCFYPSISLLFCIYCRVHILIIPLFPISCCFYYYIFSPFLMKSNICVYTCADFPHFSDNLLNAALPLNMCDYDLRASQKHITNENSTSWTVIFSCHCCWPLWCAYAENLLIANSEHLSCTFHSVCFNCQKLCMSRAV